jgi:hypothetical protein
VTVLRKGRAVAILWADLPAARRGDLETWATGEALAPADPGTGVLAVGRYAGISGGPAFLEVHELASDDAAVVAASARLLAPTLRALERLGATIWPGGAAVEPGGPRPAEGSAGVYGQIFPPGIDERAAIHGPPPVLQIGRIDIPPAHEDEFNEWYNTDYLLAIALLGVPLPVEAQQATPPAVGFLRSTPSAPFTHLVTAFRQGLNEGGFIEGQNVAVEYRWADNRLDRLPGLVAELLRRPVAVHRRQQRGGAGGQGRHPDDPHRLRHG